MELIDRYVAEVGRHIPEKMRSDIEAEIRSLLEDNLEDRARQQGRQPDEEMVVEMLKSYGKPEKVAATYQPPRYLIGPRLYPTFLMVVRIMLLVVFILSLVKFGFAVTLSNGGLAQIGLSFVEALNTFLSGALTALGVIVVVFAILQWKLPQQGKESDDWDPRKLEPVTPRGDQVKTRSMIIETVLAVVFLLAFILYADRIGVYMLVDGSWVFAPVLTQTFYNFLPWICALWGLGILLNLAVLRKGRWQPATRWISAGLTLLNIVLLLVLLGGAPIVESTPQALEILKGMNVAPDVTARLGDGLGLLVRMILAVLLIVEAVDLGQTLYNLLWKKTSE